MELNKIGKLITLDNFTLFPEYFISISIIYVLIVIVLITYSVYGLLLNRAISECFSLILIMSCYLLLNDDCIVSNSVTFYSTIVNDYLAFLSKFLICFFSSLYFLIISDSLKEQKLTSFEYLLITLFSVLGLMLMCCSHDFLTAYLSIELSSLALYLLAAFKKTSSYSVESGIKYFIIGSISSAFFLLGSSFIYGLFGMINFEDFNLFFWASVRLQFLYKDLHYYQNLYKFFIGQKWGLGVLMEMFPGHNFANASFNIDFDKYIRFSSFIIRHWGDVAEVVELNVELSFAEIGVAFIVFSLLIKLAAAPFHLWSLDVYEGSPTSSTFFFAVISKYSIFILLIRIVLFEFWILDEWCYYVLWVGIFSIFVGSFGGLKQRRIKTLLAYSSITNIGYVLLALGSSSFLGFQLLFFHLIIYMLSGLCVWYILLLLRVKHKFATSKYNKELGDFALLKKSNPVLAFSLALIMFSMAGIPPIIGFLAKIGVFLSIIEYEIFTFAILGAIFSVVSTFYYIRIIKILYFENLIVGKLYYPIKTDKTIILGILIFLHIMLFINPNFIYFLSLKIYNTLNKDNYLPTLF